MCLLNESKTQDKNGSATDYFKYYFKYIQGTKNDIEKLFIFQAPPNIVQMFEFILKRGSTNK